MPELWGGPDGGLILRELFKCNFSSLLLLIPSISNPIQVIHEGLSQGYFVHTYLTTPLSFGPYTSQSYVQKKLHDMHSQGISFFFSNHYILAGVYFSKEPPTITEQEKSLIQIISTGRM
jgi:hypothetical protein